MLIICKWNIIRVLEIFYVVKMPFMNLHYNVTAPIEAASPTKSSAASDNFRVYSPHPFPPVLFEEAYESSCHSTPALPPIGSLID